MRRVEVFSWMEQLVVVLRGAVAQLGERTVRIGEVRGSIPLSSISIEPVAVRVAQYVYLSTLPAAAR